MRHSPQTSNDEHEHTAILTERKQSHNLKNVNSHTVKTHPEFHNSTHSGVNDILICTDCITKLKEIGYLYPRHLMKRAPRDALEKHKLLFENPDLEMLEAWMWLSKEAFEPEPGAWLALFRDNIQTHFANHKSLIKREEEKAGEVTHTWFVPRDAAEEEAGHDAIVKMLFENKPMRQAFVFLHKLFDEEIDTEDMSFQRLSQYYFATMAQINFVTSPIPGVVVKTPGSTEK